MKCGENQHAVRTPQEHPLPSLYASRPLMSRGFLDQVGTFRVRWRSAPAPGLYPGFLRSMHAFAAKMAKKALHFRRNSRPVRENKAFRANSNVILRRNFSGQTVQPCRQGIALPPKQPGANLLRRFACHGWHMADGSTIAARAAASAGMTLAAESGSDGGRDTRRLK